MQRPSALFGAPLGAQACPKPVRVGGASSWPLCSFPGNCTGSPPWCCLGRLPARTQQLPAASLSGQLHLCFSPPPRICPSLIPHSGHLHWLLMLLEHLDLSYPIPKISLFSQQAFSKQKLLLLPPRPFLLLGDRFRPSQILRPSSRA